MNKLTVLILLIGVAISFGCSKKQYVQNNPEARNNTSQSIEQTGISSNDSTPRIETNPQFGQGDSDLIQWMVKNVKYPFEATKEGIEGTVITRFLIDAKGIVKDVEVIQSVHPLLDTEAIRVVQSMPKWAPGKINEEPVPVYYQLPIRFRLSAEKKSKEFR